MVGNERTKRKQKTFRSSFLGIRRCSDCLQMSSRVLPTSTIAETIKIMRQANQHRAWIITSPTTKKIIASHPIFEPIADVLRDPATFDYRGHEAVFFQLGPRSETLQTATLASTKRGAGAGGVRLWQYSQLWDAVRDGVRLRSVADICAQCARLHGDVEYHGLLVSCIHGIFPFHSHARAARACAARTHSRRSGTAEERA